jgi:hypothetical protein
MDQVLLLDVDVSFSRMLLCRGVADSACRHFSRLARRVSVSSTCMAMRRSKTRMPLPRIAVTGKRPWRASWRMLPSERRDSRASSDVVASSLSLMPAACCMRRVSQGVSESPIFGIHVFVRLESHFEQRAVCLRDGRAPPQRNPTDAIEEIRRHPDRDLRRRLAQSSPAATTFDDSGAPIVDAATVRPDPFAFTLFVQHSTTSFDVRARDVADMLACTSPVGGLSVFVPAGPRRTRRTSLARAVSRVRTAMAPSAADRSSVSRAPSVEHRPSASRV